MKKSFALMLGVFALTLMWCVPVFAEYWNEGNDGNSWETAYVIDSVEDFVMMTGPRATSEDIGKYFKLSADLEFTSENYAENREHNFGGHFDGENHTVRVNILIESYGLVSLFGNVRTKDIAIRNLNVEGTVRGSSGTGTGSTLVGGIAGELSEGIIENCSFIGSVEAVGSGACAAGIASLAGSYHDSLLTSGTIRNCRFQGTVSASGTRFAHAGGITAEIGNGRIENCEVLSGSKISSSTEERGSYAGGIAGDVGPHVFEDEAALGTVYITNCTSYAEISGNGEKGGITGHGSTSKSDRIHFYGNTWPSEYPEIGNYSPASGLPIATIQPVELSQDVLEKAASAVNIDVSQLLTLSIDSISVPKEPTQAMLDYAKNDNAELTGKLNTLEVNREGYYVFKVTLSNELWEKIKNSNISDYKFYGLYDSDAKVSSSFINGLLGTWEILTMKGEKMTSFGVREFLMVAFLNAGTPFTMFLAKLIMAILGGGCNTGMISGSFAVLVLLAVKFRKR